MLKTKWKFIGYDRRHCMGNCSNPSNILFGGFSYKKTLHKLYKDKGFIKQVCMQCGESYLYRKDI